MSNAANTSLLTLTARTIRDNNPGAAADILALAYQKAPVSSLVEFGEFLTATTVVGRFSRDIISDASGKANAEIGDRLDACREGTRAYTKHLKHLIALHTMTVYS